MSKIICLLLLFALTIPISSQSKSKDALLFEISKDYNSSLKGSGTNFYIYQSGRIDYQKYRRNMGKAINGKKAKCFQISAAEISELVKLAGEPAFQTAKESYDFFSGGIDWGSSLFITYFSPNGEKNIKLGNTEFKLEPIPSSLKEFLVKIGEIDETLKVEYELDKK